ncbi:MAG: glycerol dehydratase reactivase beta/small subunit family protein [Eubacteriaceae bacterium]|jgi:hypothetical protein
MNVSFESPKPEIKLFYEAGKADPRVIDEILLGIEEEGVPAVTESRDNVENAVVLAYKAAESSHLGVGIGVADAVVLHYIKLGEDQPLYRIPLTKNSERLRAIGANAARLVKRMPFKDID